jgi:O-acetylserine/cysteine efflux transporter
MAGRMTTPHLVLAASVIGIWASNFVVVKWGLDRLPPLTLCTWRFLLSFFPICLLVPPPKDHWRLSMAFGAITGVGQFGLICIAMSGPITPGLASVVVQTQAFFNVALAAVVLREHVRIGQVLGCLLGAAGLAVIASNGGDSVTGLGLLLALLSALSWAVCNVLLKRSAFSGDLVAFLVWSSLFAVLPLTVLALLVDGAEALASPVTRPDPYLWLIIGWQAYANTIFGYGVWSELIRSYSLSRIGPLTLLVPVIAMALAALILGEALTAWKLAAAAFIVLGVSAPYAIDRAGRLAHDRREA